MSVRLLQRRHMSGCDQPGKNHCSASKIQGRNNTMKALSVRQPWAWLIASGHKDIENRSWPTRYRGRMLIHASKGMTRKEYDDVLEFLITYCLHDAAKALPKFHELDRGGIVGTVDIVDCVSDSDSPWFFGKHGFVLQNQEALPFRECKGALGFFEIEGYK